MKIVFKSTVTRPRYLSGVRIVSWVARHKLEDPRPELRPVPVAYAVGRPRRRLPGLRQAGLRRHPQGEESPPEEVPDAEAVRGADRQLPHDAGHMVREGRHRQRDQDVDRGQRRMGDPTDRGGAREWSVEAVTSPSKAEHWRTHTTAPDECVGRNMGSPGLRACSGPAAAAKSSTGSAAAIYARHGSSPWAWSWRGARSDDER